MSGEAHLLSRIDGVVEADEVVIGKGVVVEPGARLTGKSGHARRIVLGDFAYVGTNVKVMVPEFALGDYSKLHEGNFVHGIEPVTIGRNCWIGGSCVLDGMGGLTLEDNVGVGSGSQLWTHIRFGDVVEGCRFDEAKPMIVGQDAWLVGHCLVSPVAIGPRSMAMLGSVVVRDMVADRTYGGSPAVDLTDKLGPQFEARSVDQKAATLQGLIDSFEDAHPQFKGQLYVARSADDRPPGKVAFDVSTRQYTKTYAEAEVAFLRAHVPRVKFKPET
jgi:acetyltransferase-like isoleucine patch superfamily enzyme